jgi:hypothetical protein
MNDWIRLLVKYKGTCSACGKEISAGQYALWSKSSKAIKHSECKASQPPATTEKKRGRDTNRQQTTTAAAEVDCFICGRPVAGNNYGFEAGEYCRRLSAIDVWKTRMPIRTTKMHSLKRFTE